METAAPTLTTTPDLPPLLRFADGSEVRSAADWPRRRAELWATAVDLCYGGLPPRPESVAVEPLHRAEVRDTGGVKYETSRIVCIGGAERYWFNMSVMIPPGSGPFPVIVNGDGCWRYLTEAVAAAILARGVVIAQFNRTEIAEDIWRLDRTTGLYRVYPGLTFGAVAAWAWGFHRCVDALLQDKRIDAGKITVVGHSRGGKAALLAGATDERVALTSANNSGGGGAGCWHWAGEGSSRLATALRDHGSWWGAGHAELPRKGGGVAL